MSILSRGAWVGLVVMCALPACAQPGECVPAEDVMVRDPKARLSDDQRDDVRSTIVAFSRRTGFESVCVDEVLIQDAVVPAPAGGQHYPFEPEFAGVYSSVERRIVVSSSRGMASTKRTVRHELCHAYDHVRGNDGPTAAWFSDGHAETFGGRAVSSLAEGGPGDSRAIREAFAETCADGPSDWRTVAGLLRCGEVGQARRLAFMNREVFTEVDDGAGDRGPTGAVALDVEWAKVQAPAESGCYLTMRASGDWLWTWQGLGHKTGQGRPHGLTPIPWGEDRLFPPCPGPTRALPPIFAARSAAGACSATEGDARSGPSRWPAV